MEDRLTRQAERDFEIGRQNQVIAQAADTRNRLRQVSDSYAKSLRLSLLGKTRLTAVRVATTTSSLLR